MKILEIYTHQFSFALKLNRVVMLYKIKIKDQTKLELGGGGQLIGLMALTEGRLPFLHMLRKRTE